ncbi:MAG: hypothetical protein ACREGB_00170 [Candidatus Saccharimonadales bacterium]
MQCPATSIREQTVMDHPENCGVCHGQVRIPITKEDMGFVIFVGDGFGFIQTNFGHKVPFLTSDIVEEEVAGIKLDDDVVFVLEERWGRKWATSLRVSGRGL